MKSVCLNTQKFYSKFKVTYMLGKPAFIYQYNQNKTSLQPPMPSPLLQRDTLQMGCTYCHTLTQINCKSFILPQVILPPPLLLFSHGLSGLCFYYNTR